MLRWSAVAEGEVTPGKVLKVARAWVFPPAPSAWAVAHHKSLVNGVFGWFFRGLTHLLSGHLRTARRWDQPPRLTPPPSLTVIACTVAFLAAVTRSIPILVLVGAAYGFIFPWGMPGRGQVRSGKGYRAAVIATALAFLVVTTLAKLGVPILASTAACILAAPLFVAAGCFGQRPGMAIPEEVVPTRAPNGAWVVDATRVTTLATSEHALKIFVDLPCAGKRFVVTPGIGYDPKDSFRIAAQAWSTDSAVLAVGRLRAEPLLDGSRGTAERVDTMAQAIKWVNSRLTEDDAVLYLADHPTFLP